MKQRNNRTTKQRHNDEIIYQRYICGGAGERRDKTKTRRETDLAEPCLKEAERQICTAKHACLQQCCIHIVFALFYVVFVLYLKHKTCLSARVVY